MESMADPLVTLAERLRPAFEKVAGRTGVDPVVRPSDRADAQANGALALAKELGRSPRDVANEVLAACAGLSGVCSSIEVAGPGFLNLVLDEAFLAAELASLSNDERLGVSRAPSPRRVVIDYSAPNVAKEMHVGHLRTTVIGDALVRMFEFVGHSVIRENHIGDWGTPFGMLIEHLLDLGETEAAEHLSLGDLDGFYKQARAKFDASDAFKERARDRVVLLQGGDAETRRLWRLLVALSTKHFNAVYSRLGVLLVDDDLMGESAYNELMPDVIGRLDRLGLLQESDGADVVYPPGYTNRDGDPLPLIVQKGKGGFNYATSDLACVIDRVERLGADLLLYVVGAPQAQHLSMVFDVARMIGIGAVNYADLSTDRVRDYVFDWDRMLSFDGNTAPYLQYAHARICSIFRRAGVDRSSVAGRTPRIEAEQERALALALLGFDSAVADTLERYSPHRLCTYLYDLSTAFSAFYEHCPVLKAEGEVRESRLVLCDLVARVLNTGLGLLGIESPEQM